MSKIPMMTPVYMNPMLSTLDARRAPTHPAMSYPKAAKSPAAGGLPGTKDNDKRYF
jgi:hypothetical protein